MPSRRRLILLLIALGASLFALLRPVSEPVNREARWALVSEPAPEMRCPTPRPGYIRWTLAFAGDEFPWIEKQTRRTLGDTCTTACEAEVIAHMAPVWIDEPHFFSGFSHLDIPVTLTRTIGVCNDTFRLNLDMRVDEGVRGSPKLAQLHTGKLLGGFLRTLDEGRAWPRQR